MDAAGRSWHLPGRRITPIVLFLLPFVTSGSDWPQYRGANHDGSTQDRLIKQWSGSITNPIWKVPLTNGLCSLAVTGGRVFTQMWRTFGGLPKEFCLALNATNGAELWAVPLDDASYPSGGVGQDDGPRTTPAVDGDSVFVLTSYLKLYRLNITNGVTIWQRDLRVLYGSSIISWQNAASPLIENGLIYLNASSGTSTLMAIRTTDGSVAWRSQNEGLTHSTPVITTINGVRQVIFATQAGLVSVNPDTGSLFWKAQYPFTYSSSIGVSPVVYQDMVFVCGAHAYGMGSVVVQATLTNTTWTARQLWSTNNPASHWMTPVCYQGFLYGQFGIQSFDSPTAQLKCVDMRTGAVKWSVNGFGRGATILANDHLLSLTENGQLMLVKPNTNAYTLVANCLAIPGFNQFTNRCWNGPAIADGKVYVRSTAFAACFDFSIPDLKIDPPTSLGQNQFELTARTVTGSPISSNRFNTLEFRANDDPIQPVSSWTKLTNTPVLTDGVVRVQDAAAANRRFFIVTEPK